MQTSANASLATPLSFLAALTIYIFCILYSALVSIDSYSFFEVLHLLLSFLCNYLSP